MISYDLCVLGGGPGGFSAAIRAAKAGANVCLVDPGPLGGTCLNRGCIPARALGTTARLMGQLKKADLLGIQIDGGVRLDLEKVLSRKERILRRLRTGLNSLIQQNRITWLQGRGNLQGPQEVAVEFADKPAAGVKATAVILATGSRPGSFPGCRPDGKTIITSDEILELRSMPSSLIVVGAGVIGSEFASYFADLGVSVTVIEAAEQILPAEDERIAQAFEQSLKRRGVQVLTRTKVTQTAAHPSGSTSVTLQNGQTLEAALVLIATGRAANLPEGTETVGVELENGFLRVDDLFRTNVPSLFGVGDLLGEYQLASTASYEGAVAAENALGGARHRQYAAVPEAIYTEPEIAGVGLNEAEAKQAGYDVRASRLSFSGFPRAQTLEETEGFIQVVADRTSGKILGVQILGARATDLIGEAGLAIQQGLGLKELAETLHGHPTMSESLWEAAAMALDQSIYYALDE